MRSRGVKLCLENWGGFAEQVVINLGFERGTRRIQLLGVGGGVAGLACCGPWGREVSDTTERLNGTWTQEVLVLNLGLATNQLS